MNFPRRLAAHLASALLLGCVLLACAPSASAQGQIKLVAVDSASFERMAKFIESVNANPASKAAMDEMGKDQELGAKVMSGDSVNDAINAKYPKAAAVFKSGGYTPDEFNAVALSLVVAAMGTPDGTSDPAIAKANIEFYNANKEKIEKAMASMR